MIKGKNPFEIFPTGNDFPTAREGRRIKSGKSCFYYGIQRDSVQCTFGGDPQGSKHFFVQNQKKIWQKNACGAKPNKDSPKTKKMLRPARKPLTVHPHFFGAARRQKYTSFFFGQAPLTARTDRRQRARKPKKMLGAKETVLRRNPENRKSKNDIFVCLLAQGCAQLRDGAVHTRVCAAS